MDTKKTNLLGLMEIYNLGLDRVIRTYSGKPGCMCGCRGKYTDGAAKRTILNMLKLAQEGFEVEFIGDGLDGEKIFSIETETRQYAIYYK